ncbi:hypothetical protein WJX74_006537 [Apatococcus lobatus]
MYRSVMRWAKAYGEVPLVLNPADTKAVLPAAVGRNGKRAYDLENTSVKHLARQAFAACKNFEGDAQDMAWDRGLKAVQLLHHDYTGRAERIVETQAAHADRNNVHYCVGQVFRHRTYGYKGVIYGWDRSCERDQSWNDKFNVDPNQPFYCVLPDEVDCQRLFGGVRISKYVAQENIQLVKSERGVTHRAITNYFSSFNPHLDRYVPNAHLAFEYPNDFVTEEDVTVSDANAPAAEAEGATEAAAPAAEDDPEIDVQAVEKG